MKVITGTIESLELDEGLTYMRVQAREKSVTYISPTEPLLERLGLLFDGALEVDEETRTKTLIREKVLGERIGFRYDCNDKAIFRIH